MPSVQDDVSKVLMFKEEESKKVDAIKDIIKSKLFVAMMIIFSIANLVGILNIIISSVSSSDFEFNSIFNLIFTTFLDLIIPGIFLYMLYNLYLCANKKNKKGTSNSVLGRIFAIRRFGKYILIILAILNILNGFSFVNIERVYSQNPSIIETLDVISPDDFSLIISEGRYLIFFGLIFALIAYAMLSSTKTFFKAIVTDEVNNKYVEMLIFIGLLIGYGVLIIAGDAISFIGVSSPLTPVIYHIYNFSDVMILISDILSVAFLFIAAYIIHLIRKALMNNSGSNSILENEIVYTIKEEDIEEK